MSDHRRTVSRKAYVLPGWGLLLVLLLVVGGAGWLGWLVVSGDDDGAAPTAAPTASATAEPTPDTSASPTPSASAEPTPSATEPTPTEPTPTEPEPTAGADRSAIGVSVLNASRTGGLAATVSQQVEAAGWTVGAVGNWRGSVAENSVHYPQGREAEARLLAEDLGIAAVAPVQNGMTTERLTVLLVTTP